jgi:hypothetical protein
MIHNRPCRRNLFPSVHFLCIAYAACSIEFVLLQPLKKILLFCIKYLWLRVHDIATWITFVPHKTTTIEYEGFEHEEKKKQNKWETRWKQNYNLSIAINWKSECFLRILFWSWRSRFYFLNLQANCSIHNDLLIIFYNNNTRSFYFMSTNKKTCSI